jgi:hypothetical protein
MWQENQKPDQDQTQKRGGLKADLITGLSPIPVGASLLAMVANDDAPCLDERVVWTLIASRLAPTGDWGYLQRSGRL